MKRRAASKRYEDALDRRVALAGEIETLTEQLTGLEAAEGALLRARAPLGDLKDARQSVEVARLQIQHAQTELAEVDAALPGLEKESEHAERVLDMSLAAQGALEAEGRIREILRGILEREAPALLELTAAHEALDGAILNYEGIGRQVIPGTSYNGESNWLHGSETKRDLEAAIQQGGTSLRAVKGNLEPEGSTVPELLVWGVYSDLRGRSRAARLAAEEEAFRKEQAAREEARRAQRGYDPSIY